MQLTLQDVRKSFDRQEVLRGLNFTFESGKIYGLLGRNGAGKTTLFNCINRDMPCDHGSFTLTDGESSRAIDSQDIGYVLSTPVVPEFLTGREFLRFFIDINRSGISGPDDTDFWFDLVQIDAPDRDKLMKYYSHGMKNKLQLLVNLMVSPQLLLLDEPLTSLDVVVAEEMKGILRRIKGDCIVILSTHILDLALDLCDEIVLLHHGVLERVEKSDACSGDFREKVLAALKEESHANGT